MTIPLEEDTVLTRLASFLGPVPLSTTHAARATVIIGTILSIINQTNWRGNLFPRSARSR